MSDTINLPRERAYREPVMGAMPHPADARKLELKGRMITCEGRMVADLGKAAYDLKDDTRKEILSLLADALTHGYRCATADMRRILDHGAKRHG
jgi:hypothetical protein